MIMLRVRFVRIVEIMTDTGFKSCCNCIHCYHNEWCVLLDDLITVMGVCPMWRSQYG